MQECDTNKRPTTKTCIFMKTNQRSRRTRKREYLTPQEVQKLLSAARNGATRNPERDHCILLLMYHHGLRVSELTALKLSDIDLTDNVIHLQRLKDSASGAHPLYREDRKALKQWLAAREEFAPDNDFVFISERRDAIHRAAVWEMIRRVAEAAGLSALSVHPHTLRHRAGYDLINRGVDVRTVQAFLGHRSIQTTVRYTALAPNRFANLY